MLLDVLERLMLQGVLPSEGNFVTMRVIRDLRGELSFSETEIAEFEIADGEGQVTWNKSKESPKDITIGVKATEIIAKALEKMDAENKLTQQHLPLYEKFMGTE